MGGRHLHDRHAERAVMVIIILAALAFGVTMVMPIDGADMSVVISLLNAFIGTAVVMAGFVIGNWALIIAGALVGASGCILTKLMADAMNRSPRSVSASSVMAGVPWPVSKTHRPTLAGYLAERTAIACGSTQ
jgi:NAD(P) transhydrogenase subunit beta